MAANQLSEQEIQFRKRARRRLVGAVALVLLMVTILPMVLDDREVKPTQQDIAITIPSQDGTSFSSRIIPVAPATPSQDVQLASPLEQAPKATAEAKVEKSVAAPVSPVASPEKPLPVSKAEPVAAPVQSVEPAPVVKQDPPKPAAAKSAPAAAKNPVARKGAFSVQIGVFTEGEPLKKLEAKLAAQGFHASREKLSTPKGPKIRLRTGPYATRADAEAVQAKLKAAGTSAMVVTNK